VCLTIQVNLWFRNVAKLAFCPVYVRSDVGAAGLSRALSLSTLSLGHDNSMALIRVAIMASYAVIYYTVHSFQMDTPPNV
jgi:hypothetical protein